MKIYEIQKRDAVLTARLLEFWENSVRATHLFLSDAEVDKIKGYVPEAIRNVEHLIAAEKIDGGLAAFMGTENNRLEMLFVDSKERGKGSAGSLCSMASRSAECARLRSMNKIRRRSAFIGIWDLKHIKEAILMKKAIPIRFCI